MAGKLKGWRYCVFVGTFISSVLGCLYFTAFKPMINPDPYKMIREKVLQKLPPKID